jgi:hypothetical protein
MRCEALATRQVKRVIQPGVIQYQDTDLWQSESAGERTPRMELGRGYRQRRQAAASNPMGIGDAELDAQLGHATVTIY